jgi:hypothetical protein
MNRIENSGLTRTIVAYKTVELHPQSQIGSRNILEIDQ